MQLIFPAWLQPTSLLFALVIFLGSVNAQAQNSNGTEILITGNPLGREETTLPVSAMGRLELIERGQSTLGETLNNLPGVSSTYFGPNASRPVIRGLDGDRIRVLNNSTSSLDVSALSYDHAVPMDVLSTERIEVLRGPATLQYGGSAVGGVVNVIDNRIPSEAMQGVLGKVQMQAGSGNDERSLAALMEAGNGQWGLHVDGFERKTSDVAVPLLLGCAKSGDFQLAHRICNSASQSQGQALGGTTFWDQGYLGASINQYQSNYGTVAEDNVVIGMHSTRYAMQGQLIKLPGWIDSVKANLSYTDYNHTEFDNAQPGTVFASQGWDFRVEARHLDWLGWQGVIGLHSQSNRFSAAGAEAFAPYSRTNSQALFVHEERATPWGQVNAGARWESIQVQSLGNPEVARFDTSIGAKKFTPFSLAGGAQFKLSTDWSFSGNAALSQRAPKDYELYANGPHVATHAWEIGDTSLGLEKSRSIDVGLAWHSGPNRVNLTTYVSRYDQYIGLMSGSDSVANLPSLRYQGVKALFEGFEASGRIGLWHHSSSFDLDWRADSVRATNESTSQPLPRIAPLRLGYTLVYAEGPWSAKLGADWHAPQTRVPEGSVATNAYTLVYLNLNMRQRLESNDLTWFFRIDNLTNQLAYSATSILTSTAFGKAPLPGRSLLMGLKANF